MHVGNRCLFDNVQDLLSQTHYQYIIVLAVSVASTHLIKSYTMPQTKLIKENPSVCVCVWVCVHVCVRDWSAVKLLVSTSFSVQASLFSL